MTANQDSKESALPLEAASTPDTLGRRKLRNLLIAPKTQFRTAIIIFSLGFLFISIVFGNLLYRLNDLIFTLADMAGDPVHAAAATSSTTTVLVLTYIFLLVGFLCSALYLALTITHRYLGPMVPILKHVKGLLEGDFQNRIYLRKGDEFQELAADLNRLAEQLQKKSGSN